MPMTATVNYHVKRHTAQAFRFDVDGIPGNLIAPELLPTRVAVTDLRTQSLNLNFETDGILFAEAPTAIADFSTASDWEERYNVEMESLLRDRLGAREVIVFDHTVRVDDPDAIRQPARNVHNDYSQQGAQQRLEDIVGQQRAREFRAGHFAFVNVWRPVAQTIRTSPLGFIYPQTVQPEDWMKIELVYPDRRGQILGVAANPAHQWFFRSNMTPDEVAIFNIYDNRDRPYLAHSALDMEGDTAPTSPRKSIESRTLVRYGD